VCVVVASVTDWLTFPDRERVTVLEVNEPPGPVNETPAERPRTSLVIVPVVVFAYDAPVISPFASYAGVARTLPSTLTVFTKPSVR
jgi:hypothetical protein